MCNLVENAIQAFVYDITDKVLEKGLFLNVDLAILDRLPSGEKGQVHIKVQDNGPGIDPNKFKDFLSGIFKSHSLYRTREDL